MGSVSSDINADSQIPADIVWRIFHAVTHDKTEGVQTLIKLSTVCKAWYLKINKGQDLWRAMATTLSADCFPPDRLKHPDSLLFSASRDLGGSPASSWSTVCKLYWGWRKAFVAQRQTEIQPELISANFLALPAKVLPSIPGDCERHVLFSIHASNLPTNYLVKQRHSTDLPELQNRLICTSSDLQARQFRVLSCSSAIDARVEPSLVDMPSFPAALGSPGECVRGWGRYFPKPLHKRRVRDSTSFQKIFEAHKDLGGCMRTRKSIDQQQEQAEGDFCSDEEEVYFVVHNLHADVETWDLWFVKGEPVLCAYWQDRLVYTKYPDCNFFGSVIIERARAGVYEKCWSKRFTEDCIPVLLEVNSQFIAVVLDNSSPEYEGYLLQLRSIETGEEIKSVPISSSDSNVPDRRIENMLLTDGFLVLNIREMDVNGEVKNKVPTIIIYDLPGLLPLYSLPSAACNLYVEPAMAHFMALSSCGRYLGVSTDHVGSTLTLYDMLAGRIKYYEYNRKFGDGVWLWYRDVKMQDGSTSDHGALLIRHEQIVEEKVVFWQLGA